MRSLACMTCAKQKIRCDKKEPCLNCKKRHKSCIYADDLSNARIKQLEAQVRSLGGVPGVPGDIQAKSPSDQASQASTVLEKNDNAAMLDEAENGSQYIETPIWRAWNGNDYGPSLNLKSSLGYNNDQLGDSIFASGTSQQPDVSFRDAHPSSKDAAYLWEAYFSRVHPLTKLFFEQDVEGIRSKCIAESIDFTDQEHALIFAVYLIAVQSLTDDSCVVPGKSRSELLRVYQRLCEDAFESYRGLAVHDIMTLQILILYLYALFTKDKFLNSWDAMGFVLRKAERLGLHRDGTYLNLSVYETERRRRIWWFLQHMDLGSSSVSGATSMSLISDWDTKLPLNIEDTDITNQMESPPVERTGLTSMSYCLWRYWGISELRKITDDRGRRLGASWTVSTLLSLETRRAIVDRIETGLVERYLKHCNPIQSLDMLVLLMARNLVSWYRRNLITPGAGFKDAKDFKEEDHQALLAASLETLSFDQAVFETACLEPYRWDWRHVFPWSSFVLVLLTIPKKASLVDAGKLWDVVSCTYGYSPELHHSNMDLDRRKVHVAKLTLNAWSYLQGLRISEGLPTVDKPEFISMLENYLSDIKNATNTAHEIRVENATNVDDSVLHNGIGSWPVSFEDIDWTFWDIPTEHESLNGQDNQDYVNS